MVDASVIAQIEEFVEINKEETIELLKTLTKIPAPSGKEETKALYVFKWLEYIGAEGAWIDEAGNVVYEYRTENSGEDIILFMAHMDVVFPDVDPVKIVSEKGKIFAPGVGDDNADLANMLMGIKFLLKYHPEFPVRLMFVANVGEEGLGNLKGSRYIYEKYGKNVCEFIGFDANLNHIVNVAVGSHRYKVTVRTEGGHSYTAFGNKNAIYQLSCILQELYKVDVPKRAKTTYNVGAISGGTSVNTIAQRASMLYEFRSEDVTCLKEMEMYFESVIEKFRAAGFEIEVETIGIRPCGAGVDEEKQCALTKRHRRIIEQFSDITVEEKTGSTDANIFLAHGIPSNVLGTKICGGTHTREEWIETASLIQGQKSGSPAS